MNLPRKASSATIGASASDRHDLAGKKIAAAPVNDTWRFGEQLRRARLEHHLTQEDLAAAAEISARHLSFLENGRALPSRDMVLRLGAALALSDSACNALLRAAGFAPAFAPRDLIPGDAERTRHAVMEFLTHQEPIPALATDPFGFMIAANEAAQRLFFAMMGANAAPSDNIYEPFFLDPRMRASVVNWAETAPGLLRHLEREAASQPDNPPVRSLLAKLGRAVGELPDETPAELPIFRLEIKVGGEILRFTSNYSTFGVPYDATMQSIRIECFFPADAATRDFLERRD